MNKLQALVAALIHRGVSAEHITWRIAKGDLLPAAQDLGLGIQVGTYKYTAVLQVAQWSEPLSALFAWLQLWLDEHDGEREQQRLTPTTAGASPHEDSSMSVELTIEFEENLEVLPDPAGCIEYRGQRWKTQAVPINVAEELVAMHGQAVVD